MGKENPPWLQEARDFCRTSGITIVGWGPDMLTVEAKTEARAAEIASQLGQLGFKVVKDEDNAYAGLLDLSKNPAVVQAKIVSLDVSHRRWDEQIEPLIWLVGSLLLVPAIGTNAGRYPYALSLPLGILSVIAFFWDGARIWGWRLKLLPEAVHVQRYFRWRSIPWEQIHTVETVSAGRSQEAVIIKLASHASERLGTFGDAFARRLRDRLRSELAQRRGQSV